MSALSDSVRRQCVDDFFHRQVQALPGGIRVLDLGGTKRAKRGTFDVEAYPLCVTYANIGLEKQPDVQADAAVLPFAAASFDAVICAELLEHVADPAPVLAQAWRVLRPGGTLLISVPFLYRIHGHPYDYGRYTDQYWQERLSGVGFTAITCERHGLFFSVLLDMSKQFVNRKLGRPWRWGAAPLFDALQSSAQRYEAQPHVGEDPFVRSFTTGFGIIAQKHAQKGE